MKKAIIPHKWYTTLDASLRERAMVAVRRLRMPKSRLLRNALTSYLDYLEGKEKK